MARKIQFSDLNVEKEVFEKDFKNKTYTELYEIYKIKEDPLRRISKELGIKKEQADIYNKEKHLKISKSLKKYNQDLSGEKKEKISKKMAQVAFEKSTAFKSLAERCKDAKLDMLITKEEYWNTKFSHITFKCQECESEFNIRKSTTSLYPVCEKCHPKTIKKSKTQYEIYQWLLENNFNCEYNTKSLLTDSELDIIIRDKNLAIEYNGLNFHSSGAKTEWLKWEDTPKNYHVTKTNRSEGMGFNLLHIFENEWYYKRTRNIWKSVILGKLNKNKRVFARKCIIKIVDNKDSKNFLMENHLQGDINASIRYGLFYNDELVQIATFSKHKKYQYELKRLASKKGVNVVGGASRLIKHFEREHNPKMLMSYANRRYSSGNVYEKIGFEKDHITPPNFFYFKNSMKLESRQKYQKHKLKDIQGFVFNKDKTGFENMRENGYRWIYDSGNICYIKRI